jgi:hypothetical protein
VAADTLVVAEDFVEGMDMAWASGSGLALGIMAIPTTHTGVATGGTLTPIPLAMDPMTIMARRRLLPIRGLIHTPPVDHLKPPMKPSRALDHDLIGIIAPAQRAITLT